MVFPVPLRLQHENQNLNLNSNCFELSQKLYKKNEKEKLNCKRSIMLPVGLSNMEMPP
jgi:hypothetical protein